MTTIRMAKAPALDFGPTSAGSRGLSYGLADWVIVSTFSPCSRTRAGSCGAADGTQHRVDLLGNDLGTFRIGVQVVSEVFVVEVGADIGQRDSMFLAKRLQPTVVEIPLGVDFAGHAWREHGFVRLRHVEQDRLLAVVNN